jgi:hypothetical protein
VPTAETEQKKTAMKLGDLGKLIARGEDSRLQFKADVHILNELDKYYTKKAAARRENAL